MKKVWKLIVCTLYISSLDIVLRTCQIRCLIKEDGLQESKESALSTGFNVDADDEIRKGVFFYPPHLTANSMVDDSQKEICRMILCIESNECLV